ncbi:unnamed protein product [Enterobius vermicularis]|uniref:FERM domain-containing protein n=1 Tax=Enterobius vermicularis TaxID=51028 RepID=A0A3P6IQ34_ENTVE|nr:unnamed protein product [Enterobius vermicularis]
MSYINCSFFKKKAEGSELYAKVVEHLQLLEKEYFSLSFVDAENVKMVNAGIIVHSFLLLRLGKVYDFKFEVKFYPPDPTVLNDDIARHLIYLQVCQDLDSGKLVFVASQALLGSCIAQAEMGDYDSSKNYSALAERHLFTRNVALRFRGKTASEAESCFLDNAKRLSLYGIEFFDAKSSKDFWVRVGISAHGIDIYREQIRLHRFLWQNIIKIAFRWNVFGIKLRPGELEKNNYVEYKRSNYDAAKRVWKCAVENHTFFRLIQPDEKPQKKLFRWGSARFRYQGRTQFQSKMASQMFDHSSATLPRDQSLNLPLQGDSGYYDFDELLILHVKLSYSFFRRTTKTQQAKHTIQKQTYQTYTAPNEDGEVGIQTVEASQQLITPLGEAAVVNGTAPIIETRSHVVSYESTDPIIDDSYKMSDLPGELVSSRTITSGNRTFETITYKTEKNGIIETHVEHRVTIHSKGDIDHDAELCQAILEATDMNPDMTVEKIEVRQESQS